jgi:GDP-L-fucose synthase
MIASKLGYGGNIIYDTSKPDGQPRRRLDVSLAKAWLGFKAETNLDEGLNKTLEWYLSNKGE